MCAIFFYCGHSFLYENKVSLNLCKIHDKYSHDSAVHTKLLFQLLDGISDFGGAEVACWPLIPKFAGSNPAEAVRFLQGDKNPQHAFLWKGSKIIGPMSQICGM